jgi:hypothetical protein
MTNERYRKASEGNQTMGTVRVHSLRPMIMPQEDLLLGQE